MNIEFDDQPNRPFDPTNSNVEIFMYEDGPNGTRIPKKNPTFMNINRFCGGKRKFLWISYPYDWESEEKFRLYVSNKTDVDNNIGCYRCGGQPFAAYHLRVILLNGLFHLVVSDIEDEMECYSTGSCQWFVPERDNSDYKNIDKKLIDIFIDQTR